MQSPRILLTAFDPYGRWADNSSWLTLIELTRELPGAWNVTTRRYPVDLPRMIERLHQDLQSDFAFSVHLGQSPGATAIELEAIALNLFRGEEAEEASALDPAGPLALQCPLPLERLARQVRQAQLPCRVSYHAGTYLCNAVYFAAAWRARQQRLATRSLLVHLPLAAQQVLDQPDPQPAWPVTALAAAIRILLGQLIEMPVDDGPVPA